jgi:hypothetical protein
MVRYNWGALRISGPYLTPLSSLRFSGFQMGKVPST